MPPTSEHEHLIFTIDGALRESAQAFSELVQASCQLTDAAVVMRTVSDLPDILGDADEPVTGVLLTVSRDLTGFLVIVVPVRQVDVLADHLVGGCNDCELLESALGEIGNVVGSAFLNHLADEFGMTVVPTPPQVVHDMAGALLGTLAAYLALDGHVEFPVIQTGFQGEHQAFTAYLLWLPGELQVLGERV